VVDGFSYLVMIDRHLEAEHLDRRCHLLACWPAHVQTSTLGCAVTVSP
jgi:hypothetical protein